MSLKHYSCNTEDAYAGWIKRCTLCVFHRKRHPGEGSTEVEVFLTHPTVVV